MKNDDFWKKEMAVQQDVQIVAAWGSSTVRTGCGTSCFLRCTRSRHSSSSSTSWTVCSIPQPSSVLEVEGAWLDAMNWKLDRSFQRWSLPVRLQDLQAAMPNIKCWRYIVQWSALCSDHASEAKACWVIPEKTPYYAPQGGGSQEAMMGRIILCIVCWSCGEQMNLMRRR